MVGATGNRRSVADERCGHTHEASAVTGLGGVCCWRPVWGDTDRCIWHADVAQKPSRQLEETAPTVGERLDGAIFRDVELSDADWPSGLTITDARFVNCNLEGTDLSGTDLRYSQFEGVDAQGVNLRGANLEHAEFDRTDLRGADLCGARLHYAVFDNARIAEETTFGKNVVYEEELLDTDDDRRISALDVVGPKHPDDNRLDRYEAAHWTYSELQRLAEDNGLTAASREYYRKRKNIRRREAWEFRSYPQALAKEAWRWTTGYGSNPWRVIATSIVVILLCGVIYPLTSGVIEPTAETTVTYQIKPSQGIYLNFVYILKTVYFSTVTFATLGYGDMQPLHGWARALAALEALLGQLLMALLVFVLTRNVTWSE
ncbi:pentapeptide repeat-containing protein [Halorussus caseinilyticus]|uniref:Pentapeptide repeat-containing protein n=2 Tax=Halorussus caseinilyticus TaxID=3034025 RepID=A0ABD5WNT0_9EURY